MHAVARLAALPDQHAPMTDQIPQVAKRLVGYETRLAEPELTHPGQPAAVCDVGLAAAQLPHMLRVQQLRLDAGGGECAPRRVPIDAGPLQAAASTPCPVSQATRVSRPLASALKVRVSQVGSLRGVAHSRKVAMISSLCHVESRGTVVYFMPSGR